MQKEKKDLKIEKGDIVTISYKLYDNKKTLVDVSEENLLLHYGTTVINKELEKKLKGKSIGETIEIKQEFKTKAPLIELTFDDLDDENTHEYKEGEVIELSTKGKTSLFIIEKINNVTGIMHVRYKNPFDNTMLTNKIKIVDIKKGDHAKRRKN